MIDLGALNETQPHDVGWKFFDHRLLVLPRTKNMITMESTLLTWIAHQFRTICRCSHQKSSLCWETSPAEAPLRMYDLRHCMRRVR